MCICSTASLHRRRRREVWINEKERNKAGLVFLALNGIEAKVNEYSSQRGSKFLGSKYQTIYLQFCPWMCYAFTTEYKVIQSKLSHLSCMKLATGQLIIFLKVSYIGNHNKNYISSRLYFSLKHKCTFIGQSFYVESGPFFECMANHGFLALFLTSPVWVSLK